MFKFLAQVRTGFESHGVVELRCVVTEAPDELTARAQLEKVGLIVEFIEQV